MTDVDAIFVYYIGQNKEKNMDRRVLNIHGIVESFRADFKRSKLPESPETHYFFKFDEIRLFQNFFHVGKIIQIIGLRLTQPPPPPPPF